MKDLSADPARTNRPGVEEAAAAIDNQDPAATAALSAAAAVLKDSLCGRRVTFVVNRNINFTNVCAVNCLFCGYSVAPDGEGAYLLTYEDAAGKIREALPLGITEVCMTGGLHPALGLGYLTGMLSAIRESFPGIHIHAFSPMEVHWFARREGISVGDVLMRLKDAGLGSMPGTAAEVLVDEVRKVICPGKMDTAQWVEVVKTAHRMEIKTTATLMFGHIETAHHIARHLSILREIQEETGGFTEFVPLPFIGRRTALRDGTAPQDSARV
ncbi:MAG: CofH family radical SAM protein, partial [Desulfobaccales bacterium]